MKTMCWLLIIGLFLSPMACSDERGGGEFDTDIDFDTAADGDAGVQSLLDTFGPWDVGYQKFDVVDGNRADRTLPLDVWYPIDEANADGALAEYPLAAGIGLPALVAFADAPVAAHGDFPLVVFSHGFEAVSTQSTPLCEALASYGYVVVAPEHIGNSRSTPGDSEEEAGINRFHDVDFVIESMVGFGEDSNNAFFGAIDGALVGVTGHSFGGWTSMASAVGIEGETPNSRVTAIAPISGLFIDAFTEAQLAALDLPAFLLGGTLDTRVPIENNNFAFANLAAPVYQADVIGATHTHFANVCDIGSMLLDMGFTPDAWATLGAEGLVDPYEATCTPDVFPIMEALRLQNLYIIAFFNQHLGGIDGFADILTEQYALDNELAVDFTAK